MMFELELEQSCTYYANIMHNLSHRPKKIFLSKFVYLHVLYLTSYLTIWRFDLLAKSSYMFTVS